MKLNQLTNSQQATDLKKLEYLVAAVEYGNYSTAAKSMYATPQAVSNAMRKLESELRVKLFVKSGSGADPTLAARELAEDALELIKRYEDFRTHASLLVEGDASKDGFSKFLSIAVAASPYEGRAVFQECFLIFHEQYPEIDLSVTYESSGACLFAVHEESADAAMVFGRYVEDGFLCSRLFDAPLYALASKDHPLVAKQPVSLVEIGEYPIAKPYDLGSCHPLVDKRFKEQGIHLTYEKPMTFMDEYEDFTFKKNGIGLVPRDPHMEAFYPGIVFLSLREEDAISVPICLVAKNESKLLKLLHRCLLKYR